MKRFPLLFSLALILISATPSLSAEPKPLEEFTGRVEKNRDFHRDLKSFKGLTFRLQADLKSGHKQGWTVMVTPQRAPGNDYAKIATAPFNGYNPRFLTLGFGHKPESVVKQNPREFRFVTNEVGYKKAFDKVETMMWPSTRQDAVSMNEFPRGVFTITGSGISENSIEYLNFKVQIYPPSNRS